MSHAGDTDLGRYLSGARGALERSDYRKAIELCEEALELAATPSPGEDDETIRMFFASQLDFVSVARVYQALCTVDLVERKSLTWMLNPPAEASFLMGQAYIGLEDYAKACSCLETACALHPHHPGYLCELGYCYGKLRRFARAKSVYEEALDACRRIPLAEIASGIEKLESLAKALPDGSPEQNDLDGEAKAHRAMLRGRLRSEEAHALRGLGAQLIELGELDLAMCAYMESMKIEPGSRVAFNQVRYINDLKSQQTHPSCPRCGAEQYKEFRLAGRMVHKCTKCRFQDY